MAQDDDDLIRCKICYWNAHEDFNLFRQYYQLNHYDPITKKNYCETVTDAKSIMNVDTKCCGNCMRERCYVCLEEYDGTFIDVEFDEIQFFNTGDVKSYKMLSSTQVISESLCSELSSLYERYKDQYVCMMCFPHIAKHGSKATVSYYDNKVHINPYSECSDDGMQLDVSTHILHVKICDLMKDFDTYKTDMSYTLRDIEKTQDRLVEQQQTLTELIEEIQETLTHIGNVFNK